MSGKRYCYWTVATGPRAAWMQDCVHSARRCGVFTDIHVLTDRPLEDCECYDACQMEMESGLFRFIYLKVGMTKLNYDYFVWLDADTLFRRKPLDLLGCLGASPIHAPLGPILPGENLSMEGRAPASPSSSPTSPAHFAPGQTATWKGMNLAAAREAIAREGVANEPRLCHSAFWIVHRDAIDAVHDLAVGFYHKARESGVTLHAAAALGYAVQILCGNPERHLQQAHPELWAGADDSGSANPALLHLSQGSSVPPRGAV